MSDQTNSESVRREIAELANKMCDRTITPDERERLEMLLSDNPEVRSLYLDYLRVNASLIWRYRTGDTVNLSDADSSDTQIARAAADAPPQKDKGTGWSAFLGRHWGFFGALASCLLVAFLLWPRSAEESADVSPGAESTNFVATLREATNVVWSNDQDAVNVGGRIKSGSLRLGAGEAELVFDSGAKLLLAGPAKLELESPLRVFLEKGKVAAHMPSTAVGFELYTPTSKLVDQGTEFGVVVDEAGTTKVHVFRGQVDLHYADDSGSQPAQAKLSMFDRQARLIDQAGDIGKQIAFSKEDFGSLAMQVAEPIEWKISDGGNGHYYQLVVEKKPITWHEAARLAMTKHFRGMPGHLVTMTSAAEDRFVIDNLIGDLSLRGVWMGLTDMLRESHYCWVTGEPYSYTNWAQWPEQQPDNFYEADWHGGEDYGMYAQFPGKQPWAWNDLSIDSMHEKVSAYIVEYEPPVAALKHRSMVLDPIHWPVENGGNGHYYQMVLSLESTDWQTIRERAEATKLLGVQGQLVAMETEEERAFVAEGILRICGIPELMIGLSGSLEQDDLRWISGQRVAGFEIERSHLPTDMVYGVFRWNPAGKWQSGWEIRAISTDVLPAGWFGYLIEYPVESEGLRL